MIEGFSPHKLDRRDLRRLVGELWPDERCAPIAPAVLDAAVTANAKSLDRAVLTAYLRHFPRDHSSFERLRAGSELTANRRDWLWRERGDTWQLWDPDAGPKRLAAALLEHEDPARVLREVGLDGDLAQGQFVADAVEAACDQAGNARGEQAQVRGEKLIALFDRLAITGQDAMLAWALLAPWADRNPTDDYRDEIATLLVSRVGDPRLDSARWEAIATDMPGQSGGELVSMVRRWMTQRTVRQFFSIVGATTNDPKQWEAREEFWLAYLDAGAIGEAWFAFGRQAEALAQDAIKAEGDLLYGEITGGGADPSHSALIMSIGDVRIAEWSHNGACRFWSCNDRQAPLPYKKQYFGMQLRAMNGGRGFEEQFTTIPHTSGWQANIANFVHDHAGCQHPRWGAGYRSRGWY